MFKLESIESEIDRLDIQTAKNLSLDLHHFSTVNRFIIATLDHNVILISKCFAPSLICSYTSS